MTVILDDDIGGIAFKSLEAGDSFTVENDFNLMIKVVSFAGNDNAVNLKTGQAEYIDLDIVVIKWKAEITAIREL